MQNKFFDSSLPKCCSQVKPRTQNGSKEQVLTPDPRQRGLQRVLRDITTLTFSYIQHPSHLTHLQHIPLPALPPDPRLSTDSSEQPPPPVLSLHITSWQDYIITHSSRSTVQLGGHQENKCILSVMMMMMMMMMMMAASVRGNHVWPLAAGVKRTIVAAAALSTTEMTSWHG